MTSEKHKNNLGFSYSVRWQCILLREATKNSPNTK